MMKIYRFLMVLGLLVWMAQNVSSQSRYDKDKLYNVFPAKVSNKVLGYDKGSSVILKSLSKDDQKQQWNINELSGSFRFVNVFEDKALRADVDHKALVVTEVNGSDEAQLWSIQETANGVRLAPANTPSLMLVCQKDGRLQLMDRKKAETMEASLFQIRNFGQIFITDTNRGHLDRILHKVGSDYKIFRVEEGTIQETEANNEAQ